jgi:hypothetical protein
MQNTGEDDGGQCMRDAASRVRVSEVVVYGVGANVRKDWVNEGINRALTWLFDEYMRTIILVSIGMVECCGG